MKKTFIILAAMLMSSIVVRAWNVGDFYDQDPTGVPAIVVYVDESGEHGLIMAPQAYTDKGYKSFCKSLDNNRKKFEKRAAKYSIDKREEQFNKVMEWLKTAPRYVETKANKKSTVYSDVALLNTDYGLDNQKAIIKYCQDNNVDMGAYFFQANWALQLGEDWFIPGNHELELFSLHFGNGLGDKNKIKYNTWLDNHNAWVDNLGLMALPTLYNGWVDPHAIFPDYNMNSSTLQPKSKTEYYKLNVGIKALNAVWYLYYGSSESGHIVAFKYF